jgi:metal iron transporter
MNCPSRNDDIDKHPHWNQTPPALTADLTTRADLNGIANIRELDHAVDANQSDKGEVGSIKDAPISKSNKPASAGQQVEAEKNSSTALSAEQHGRRDKQAFVDRLRQRTRRLAAILIKYSRFIGPGFLIAVAYIDPGNYATDVNGKWDCPRSAPGSFHSWY